MELNAIYDKGRLNFTQPVRFVRDRISIRVVVADDEVVLGAEGKPDLRGSGKWGLPPDLEMESENLRERLDRIRNAPLPPEETLSPLTEKQKERMEAFAYREGLRKER
jgi:hypothetical protein